MSKLKFCNLEDMRPTQASVGLQEVEAKEWEILKIKKEDLDEWLEKHPIPAVLSPDNKMYLIDHHHLGLALWRLSERYSQEHPHDKKDNPYLKCCFSIVKDFSKTGLSKEEFFKCMESINMLHPFNELGQRINPQDLPRHIADLKDDPYRSLAGFVRKEGGYQKSEAPFTEFKWADYFRNKIPLEIVRNDIQGAIAQANHLIKIDSKCKDLPGYLSEIHPVELNDTTVGITPLTNTLVENKIKTIKNETKIIKVTNNHKRKA
jgi:hypothetical protein